MLTDYDGVKVMTKDQLLRLHDTLKEVSRSFDVRLTFV